MPPFSECVDRFHEVIIADATRNTFDFSVELRDEAIVSAQTQQPFRLYRGPGRRRHDFRGQAGNGVLERIGSDDLVHQAEFLRPHGIQLAAQHSQLQCTPVAHHPGQVVGQSHIGNESHADMGKNQRSAKIGNDEICCQNEAQACTDAVAAYSGNQRLYDRIE